ncbi:uncharacterized protein LOC125241726 [Leguminivora glycinivorella]|uniref:uncharacterized protein LOC125241726 n=1 Tax=Leguminivora glycinivorella TaxID=1035111 RepID=UPI00200C0FFC|nr:uncharacterized protein LOC125241726 [Leguminivora glycinivorella]
MGSKHNTNNPSAALREAEQRLKEARYVSGLSSPDVRNLCCALLAWQQLGHQGADSLYSFVKNIKEDEYEHERKIRVESLCETTSYGSYDATCPLSPLPSNLPTKNSSRSPCQWGSPTHHPPGHGAHMDYSASIGLVVNLPREPQMLMQCLSGPMRVPIKSPKSCSCEVTGKKIEPECCLDKKCMERLTSMESETQELRKRAGEFARREAQRAETLERAEMAWRDLDACYQRRLRAAKDKEEEYEKKMIRVLDERNKYKQACLPLVDALKKKSAMAEREQEVLKKIEQVG